ncbi:MAG: hypothetical protein MZU97_24760 [Bacillus subtilis]|nr:hypothetical protein [Bacillus subtilis]
MPEAWTPGRRFKRFLPMADFSTRRLRKATAWQNCRRVEYLRIWKHRRHRPSKVDGPDSNGMLGFGYRASGIAGLGRFDRRRFGMGIRRRMQYRRHS